MLKKKKSKKSGEGVESGKSGGSGGWKLKFLTSLFLISYPSNKDILKRTTYEILNIWLQNCESKNSSNASKLNLCYSHQSKSYRIEKSQFLSSQTLLYRKKFRVRSHEIRDLADRVEKVNFLTRPTFWIRMVPKLNFFISLYLDQYKFVSKCEWCERRTNVWNNLVSSKKSILGLTRQLADDSLESPTWAQVLPISTSFHLFRVKTKLPKSLECIWLMVFIRLKTDKNWRSYSISKFGA